MYKYSKESRKKTKKYNVPYFVTIDYYKLKIPKTRTSIINEYKPIYDHYTNKSKQIVKGYHVRTVKQHGHIFPFILYKKG